MTRTRRTEPIRTEAELRAFYCVQPDVRELEQRALSWARDLSRLDDGSAEESTPPRAQLGRWRAAVGLAAAVAVVLVAGLVALATAGNSDPPRQAAGTATPFQYSGTTLPGSVISEAQRGLAGDFAGPLLDGGTFHLRQGTGHVMVLSYIASWCKPCQEQALALDTLQRRKEYPSAIFVAIDIKDRRDTTLPLSYPIVSDPTASSQQKLGGLPIDLLPLTVLIDTQQRVAAVYRGVQWLDTIEMALRALGVRPAPGTISAPQTGVTVTINGDTPDTIYFSDVGARLDPTPTAHSNVSKNQALSIARTNLPPSSTAMGDSTAVLGYFGSSLRGLSQPGRAPLVEGPYQLAWLVSTPVIVAPTQTDGNPPHAAQPATRTCSWVSAINAHSSSVIDQFYTCTEPSRPDIAK